MKKILLSVALFLPAILLCKISNAQSTLVHYWHFNNFTGNNYLPDIPPVDADYSTIDTAKARMYYVTMQGTSSAYSTYLDYNDGDTLNLRLGASAGNSARFRNPSDSMEVRFYIPTTNYQNVVITFETEASSASHGSKNQLFDYSIDSGATWTTAGLSKTQDTITDSWSLVTVAFDSNANNKSGLIFRMKFGGPQNVGTSGNNRLDNFTVDADTLITTPPPPDTTTLIHYWHFNNYNGTDYLPNIPPIDADYSLIDTSKARLYYVTMPGTSSAYSTYMDYNGGDTINVRMGETAGNCVRFRNPCDSMEARFYIPSTGYDNIVVKFETEASSAGNGSKNQLFDYSVDSGATWITHGMSITKDSVMADWGLVTVLFDSTANNKSGLVFRMKFAGPTNVGSTGNDRLDNFTVESSTQPYNPSAVSNVASVFNTCALYPNPAANTVYIVTPVQGNKTAVIYNVNGQKVYATQQSEKVMSVNIASLQPGMYYILVHNNVTGADNALKFIKQ